MKQKVEKQQIPTFPVTIEHQIPLNRIADLICCGMEGGIGYWSVITGYVKPPALTWTMDGMDDDDPNPTVFKHIDYPINEGGAVKLQETEDGGNHPTHHFNLEKIRKGLRVMAEKYPRHFHNFLEENDDAETGDVFIQCCLFGEIVYG